MWVLSVCLAEKKKAEKFGLIKQNYNSSPIPTVHHPPFPLFHQETFSLKPSLISIRLLQVSGVGTRENYVQLLFTNQRKFDC